MKKGTVIVLACLMLWMGSAPSASAANIEEQARGILGLGVSGNPTASPAPTAVANIFAADPTPAPNAAGQGFPTLAPELTEAATASVATMPETLYIGIAQTNVTIRSSMSREASSVGYLHEGDRVQIIGYEPEWLIVTQGTPENWVMGYVLRHTVSQVYTQKAGALPYGNTPAKYTATIQYDTMLHTAPDNASDTLLRLTAGTKVAILEIENGWAKVIYWRQYGYFYLGAVDNLTPVYDVQSAQSGDTIAAFISFYNLSQQGLNPNRMLNIAKACEYISIPMEPGFEFSFNGIAGPYQYKRGYLDAMSFFEGQAVPSVGGGTCQVSSTMYNTLLPLEGGITIVYRRPHGPSGATYLPHGVDAAVGNVTLDLVFRNDYDFTVRIEASSQDGVLYIAMLKA